MGEGVRDRPGKVLALIDAHEEHPLEVEATLIQAGLRWRDLEAPVSTGTDWGDVLAAVYCSPWDAPIRKVIEPKDWVWGDPSRDLLAGVVDELRNLRAQVGNLSKVQVSQMPQPIPRPATSSGPGEGQIETGEATLTEIDALLGW